MDDSIERTEYVRERKVKWGRSEFIIREIFRDGPEEREMQKKALEILRDAPMPKKENSDKR